MMRQSFNLLTIYYDQARQTSLVATTKSALSHFYSSLAELVFEDPVRESRFPHRIHPLLGITILQEIIGTPGTFFVGSDSSLLQMYRNNSGSWTFKVIVGTNKAGCIDGKIFQVRKTLYAQC